VPGFLNRLFINQDTNAPGIYLVRLWNHPRQRFEYVWLSDRFPARKDRIRELASGKVFQHDLSKTPLPAGCAYVPLMMSVRKSGAYRGGNGLAFWPMLLEKAAAKLFGSYHAIGQGGTADLVLGSFVPRMTFGCINLREARIGYRLASGALWSELEAMEKSGFFMVAGAAGRAEVRAAARPTHTLTYRPAGAAAGDYSALTGRRLGAPQPFHSAAVFHLLHSLPLLLLPLRCLLLPPTLSPHLPCSLSPACAARR
jgi:hypothetical protein